MKSLLVRSSAIGALLLMPAFTTLAQDPRPQRPVEYSAEELDNLVAPVALYADALLAQVLVAATFPDQIVDVKRAIAWVRENAEELEIDPELICITGGSAGGHLTALAGLTARPSIATARNAA